MSRAAVDHGNGGNPLSFVGKASPTASPYGGRRTLGAGGRPKSEGGQSGHYDIDIDKMDGSVLTSIKGGMGSRELGNALLPSLLWEIRAGL